VDAYNAYTDSISSMNCKVVAAAKSIIPGGGDGLSSRSLLTKARQIDAAVSRYLLSNDPVERRDIIFQMETLIKTCNETIHSQGIYTTEQKQAVQVFREAERYFRNNCNR
jgi:predicted membrane-bound spermidine synthase